MRNQNVLVRQKVFNLAAFTAVLVLFFSFDLASNRKYVTTIDHVNDTYSSHLTEMDISPMDILKGDVPSTFIREEFPYRSAPFYVAAGSLILLIIGSLVMLVMKRPLAIAAIAAVCAIGFIILGNWLIDFSMLFPYNGNFTGSGETHIIQSRSTPIWEVITFILGLTLLFNALHTPVTRWVGKWSENSGQFFTSRLVRKRRSTPAQAE